MRGDREPRRRAAAHGRALLLLGACAAAGVLTPAAVRAAPTVRECPTGASCAVFYSSPDYAGNADARDITDSPMCIPLGSLAGSVVNDTPRPLALYSDHCTTKGLIATVDAGGKLHDIPGFVRSFASVTSPGG